MFCRKCGREVQPGHKFCMSCGAKLEDMPAAASTPEKEEVPAVAVIPKKEEVLVAAVTPEKEEVPVAASTPGKEVVTAEAVAPKKKKVWPIAAAAIVLLVVAAGAGGYFTWQHWQESQDIEDDDESVDKKHKDDTEESTENDMVSSASEERDLLLEKLDEIIDEKGYSAGNNYDMISDRGTTKFEDIGVLGSYIADLSGDDVEDLVLVYASEDFSYLYADVYTVEDEEVISVKEGLQLNNSSFWDMGSVSIYIKKTTSGYNLVCDSYSVARHYADGVSSQLYSYACDNNKYTKITSFSASGSAFEEEDINNATIMAQKAGLKNVTTAFENMFVIQDKDVTFLAGYTVQADDGIAYDQFYSVDDLKYGKVEVYELTSKGDIIEDEGERFLTETELSNYSVSIYSEDYILPMSAERLLTDADVAGIIDDEQKLRLATNEIYARHGRKFDTEFIQQYFDSKSWYTGLYDPVTFDNTIQMSEIENKNAEYLRGLYNSRYANGQ